MSAHFSPTPQDVKRYGTLRALSRSLNSQLVRTIPKQAYDDIGATLGILREGVLVFDTEDVSSVLADSCLYDWYRDGENLVQRWVATHPPQPGTDEDFLLNAYLQAVYRILVVESAVPGAGVYCRDLLNREELFVMDVAFSRTLTSGKAGIASRTVPLGEYWMTGGAGLPITSAEAIKQALHATEPAEYEALLETPGALELSIVRACLASGAAERIRYELSAPKPKQPRLTRWPGFKNRRKNR